jgi:hypothetical protein
MNKDKSIALNYNLQKDEIKLAGSKIVTNQKIGTSFYHTQLFYKHISRIFLPVAKNEQSK